MDLGAHTLWTNAIYWKLQRRERPWKEVMEIVFWGVSPDIFSFGAFAFYNFFQNGFFYEPNSEYLEPNALSFLYPATHSLVSFSIIFGILWLIRKRPYWPLGGWAIHILLDMPTHQGFFPPQFLWPFSDRTITGISWDELWFMILNYSALTTLYVHWWFAWRKERTSVR